MSIPTHCPKCKKSFKGKKIPENDREFFGYDTHFSRLISINSLEFDRTIAWLCPFCDHKWKR